MWINEFKKKTLEMIDLYIKLPTNPTSVFDINAAEWAIKTFKNDDNNQSTGYFYICGELSKPHLLLLKRLKSH